MHCSALRLTSSTSIETTVSRATTLILPRSSAATPPATTAVTARATISATPTTITTIATMESTLDNISKPFKYFRGSYSISRGVNETLGSSSHLNSPDGKSGSGLLPVAWYLAFNQGYILQYM